MIDNRQVHFHQHNDGRKPIPKGPGVFGFIGLIFWILVAVWIFK